MALYRCMGSSSTASSPEMILLTYFGSGNGNVCELIKNGATQTKYTNGSNGTTWPSQNTNLDVGTDYYVNYAYTSSLHKMALYAKTAGTFWIYECGQFPNNNAATITTKTVAANELICGRTTGNGNYMCIAYKLA